MHNLFLCYACYKHHLHWLGAYYLNKASCEVSVSSLIDFMSKGKKVEKAHQLCLIMLATNTIFID